MAINNELYFKELVEKTKRVFEIHPEFSNHFSKHAWLEGALGDPNSEIVFIAENPSEKQVSLARNPDGGEPTPEAQWFASNGDRVFRQALCELGLKTNAPNDLFGWNCYITNVIKEADYVSHWRDEEKKDPKKRLACAVTWFEVLKWELSTINPRKIIVLGEKSKFLLDHIASHCSFTFPDTRVIYHYAYVGEYADRVRRLPGGHPIRVQEYIESIRQAIAD